MTINLPLISVVMPAYNCSNLVIDSIKSVLAQSYQNLELIIVDDFSTDNTYSIISDFINDYSNIKIIKNIKNQGVGKTRNNGIKEAKGEYIAFIDSDDLWVEDKLEKQYNLLTSKGGRFCYGSYSFINNNNTPVKTPYIVPKEITYNALLKENVIGCSTVLIKKNLLENTFFTSDFFHEDFVLWLKLLKKEKTAYGITDIIVLYRTGGRSSNKLKAAKNRWLVFRKSENLSFLKSLKYIIIYGINGMKKHS